MKNIIIIGAGGHGREVADILRQQQAHGGKFNLYGFVDDNDNLHGKQIDGLTVLGGWSWLEKAKREEISVICAVGLPEVRKRVVSRALDLGLSFASAVSPLAYVSPSAKIGQGVMIFPFAGVSTATEISDHVSIHGMSLVGHDTKIGRYAAISPGVNLAGAVSVGEGCWLGIGANVIQGITIGEWSFVSVGAAVTRDVLSRVVAAGVPARAIKKREIK